MLDLFGGTLYAYMRSRRLYNCQMIDYIECKRFTPESTKNLVNNLTMHIIIQALKVKAEFDLLQ